MFKQVAVAVLGATLISASAGDAAAGRGRGKAARGPAMPAPHPENGPPAVTPGHNPMQRQGPGTVYRSASAPHRPAAGNPQQVAAVRVRDAERGRAWAYAARLRQTGRNIWSAMFGMSVGLGMLGSQVGRELAGKSFDSFLDNFTSPHVLVAGFVPTAVAMLIGEVVRNRYTDKAEKIEASVHESHNADYGHEPQR